MRPMFSSNGCAIAATSLTFISQSALEQELPARLAQADCGRFRNPTAKRVET